MDKFGYIHNQEHYDPKGLHREEHTKDVFEEIAINDIVDTSRENRRLQWEEFRTLPLARQFGMLAGALMQKASERIRDRLNGISTRKKLAIAGLPLAAAGAFYVSIPHPIASTDAYIQAGDGGINTACDASEKLAESIGLDPENGSECVYAGQNAGAELQSQHPGRATQPGEQITITLEQSLVDKLLGNRYTVTGAAKK